MTICVKFTAYFYTRARRLRPEAGCEVAAFRALVDMSRKQNFGHKFVAFPRFQVCPFLLRFYSLQVQSRVSYLLSARPVLRRPISFM